MTPMHTLAEEAGVSERTLRRAAHLGTIRAPRISPRKLELPLTEWHYVRRAWPLLAVLRSALRTERNVRFALLFGSAATGTDTPNSDIDLLVDLRDPDLERVLDLEIKLAGATGRRVEIVRLQDAAAEAAFLDEVLAQGRVLVDRDGAWPRLQRHTASPIGSDRRDKTHRARAALAGIDHLLASKRA